MAEAEEPQQFRLVAAPPVRPLAAAAGLAVLGAVLLVLGSRADSTFARVAGAVALALGLLLGLLGWVFWRRVRAEVTLDAERLAVRRGRRTRTLRWQDVAEVTATPLRLTVAPKPGPSAAKPLVVVNPQPATAATFAALADAVRARLDADRGYRSLG